MSLCWEKGAHTFQWQCEHKGPSTAPLAAQQSTGAAYWVFAFCAPCDVGLAHGYPGLKLRKLCWPELITYCPWSITSLNPGGTWGQTMIKRELPARLWLITATGRESDPDLQGIKHSVASIFYPCHSQTWLTCPITMLCKQSWNTLV